MKMINVILLLHVCAAIDSLMEYQGNCPDKLAKMMKKVGLIWVIQNIINSLIILAITITIFDGDELRAAIYKLSKSERGKNNKVDQMIDRIVIIKEAAKTPGPAWVIKMCFGGMGATIAIWLLALIH